MFRHVAATTIAMAKSAFFIRICLAVTGWQLD
jgi:hypothetical protein